MHTVSARALAQLVGNWPLVSWLGGVPGHTAHQNNGQEQDRHANIVGEVRVLIIAMDLGRYSKALIAIEPAPTSTTSSAQGGSVIIAAGIA